MSVLFLGHGTKELNPRIFEQMSTQHCCLGVWFIAEARIEHHLYTLVETGRLHPCPFPASVMSLSARLEFPLRPGIHQAGHTSGRAYSRQDIQQARHTAGRHTHISGATSEEEE